MNRLDFDKKHFRFDKAAKQPVADRAKPYRSRKTTREVYGSTYDGELPEHLVQGTVSLGNGNYRATGGRRSW